MTSWMWSCCEQVTKRPSDLAHLASEVAMGGSDREA